MKRGIESTDGGFERNTRHKIAEPSKVLHVRNLPDYATEDELTALCSPFGSVNQCLVMQQKSQAFVEMVDVAAAESVLSGLGALQPSIRGKQVYLQYSSRQYVEKKNNNGGGGGAGGQGLPAGSVLLLNITNATVPITLDNIHQVCKPYGQVLRIITFSKSSGFNALVEYANVESATAAKGYLDGKDMFQGCCTLGVSWSKRQSLVVKVNSHKSWDFTNQAMGGGQGMLQGGGILGGGNPNDPYSMNSGPPSIPINMPGAMGGMGGAMGDMGGRVIIVSGLVHDGGEVPLVDQLFTLCGYYGDVQRIKILFTKRDTALVQFNSGQQAQSAVGCLNGCPFNGSSLKVNVSKHPEVRPTQDGTDENGNLLTKEYSHSQLHRYKGRSFINLRNINGPSQVLHVANISEDVTDEALATLFTTVQDPNSGNAIVERFKNKTNQAYVSLSSVEAGVRGLVALHGYTLGRYPLRVSFSPRGGDGNNMQSNSQAMMGGAPMQQMQQMQYQQMGGQQMGQMGQMGMQYAQPTQELPYNIQQQVQQLHGIIPGPGMGM